MEQCGSYYCFWEIQLVPGGHGKERCPKWHLLPAYLAHKVRSGALLWLPPNKCNDARQRMVVPCQLIPGHYLLSLASDTSYFSPGHCTSEPANYGYSKSQLFIFMCFYARKVGTERPTRSLTVSYQLLIVDKRISLASGVP